MIIVKTSILYLKISFKCSCHALSPSDFTPVAMQTLANWSTVECHHLNVIWVEDPSIGFVSRKNFLLNNIGKSALETFAKSGLDLVSCISDFSSN